MFTTVIANPKRVLVALAFLTFPILGSVPVVVAQAITGSIYGTVKDETGGVIPGVELAITNEKTGVERRMIATTKNHPEEPP